MKHYTYHVDKSAQTPTELQDLLNKYGKEGWRAISIRHPMPTEGGFRNPIGPIIVVLERETIPEDE